MSLNRKGSLFINVITGNISNCQWFYWIHVIFLMTFPDLLAKMLKYSMRAQKHLKSKEAPWFGCCSRAALRFSFEPTLFHHQSSLLKRGVSMFFLNIPLFHHRFFSRSKTCVMLDGSMCVHSSVTVTVLWRTGDLFKVDPTSHRLTAGMHSTSFTARFPPRCRIKRAQKTDEYAWLQLKTRLSDEILRIS